MVDFFRTLLGMFRGGDGDAEGEAWIDDTANMTPREKMVRQVATIFQWGAIANFVLAILVLILLTISDTMPDVLSGILLGGFVGASDNAMMIAMLLILTNTSLILHLSVGTLAQEFWALFLAFIVIVGNIIAIIFLGFLPAIIALIPVGYALSIMIRDRQAWHGNPVSGKELRGRMRGVRAFAIITIFLTLMGSFTVILYLLQLPTVTGGVTIITGELGRLLFAGIVGIQLVLTIFIVPALTAGAVTGERERKTYDLLQTTLLSAPSFLVGKMESALGYIFLLLLSAIPLQAIAFLFGGVSEVELILAFVILVSTGFVLGALGLFFSAYTDRTLTATVRVYTTSLALALGLPMFSIIFVGNPFGQVIEGVGLQGLSPIAESTAIYVDMIVNSLNPVTAAYYTQRILINTQSIFIVDVQLGSTGGTIPVIAPWLLLTISYLGISAILILGAVRRMRRNPIQD